MQTSSQCCSRGQAHGQPEEESPIAISTTDGMHHCWLKSQAELTITPNSRVNEGHIVVLFKSIIED
jgi:hypothetical protein